MTKYQYTPIKGEGFFCVPTSLYIIMKSEKISLSLEDIISDFKYTLPPDYSIPKYIQDYEYSTETRKWGILLKKDTINSFFRKRGLPFVEMYLPINTIEEYNFYDILNTAITNNNHIILGYDYTRLCEGLKGDIGHVSIVNRIISEDIMEIIDPGPNNYGVKQVSIYDMYCSIKSWNDGLWIIQRQESNK